MSEITTLNTSTNWTASTETEWISFCAASVEQWDENRCSETAGTAGESITIYIYSATHQDDDDIGSIIIQTEVDKIVKEIKRCKPNIIDKKGRLEFDVKYDNKVYKNTSYDVLKVTPCKNGAIFDDEWNNIGELSIENIKLIYRITLDNGEEPYDEDPITIRRDEVRVWYYLRGDYNDFLPKNENTQRDFQIVVELISDTDINGVRPYGVNKQLGLMNDSGKYNFDDITIFRETGHTGESIQYEGFDFTDSCKGKSSTTCESGDFEFSTTGKTFTSYGGKSGKTICGEIVVESDSTESEKVNIPEDCVKFSVNCDESVAFFNDNVLHWSANKSMTEPVELEITASVAGDCTGVLPTPITTTFTVVKSGINGKNCGGSVYICIYAEKDSIKFEGETVNIKYWLSNSPAATDEHPDVYTDDDNLLGALTLNYPSSVPRGTTTLNNSIKNDSVRFLAGGDEGKTFVFTATCEPSGAEQKTVSIYQPSRYEKIIPNCDYFVFTYEWEGTSTSNVDLDSLTVIHNLPKLVAWREGSNINEKPLSKIAVGYHGNSDKDKPFKHDTDKERTFVNARVLNENGQGFTSKPILKHGGDNLCSGAEGAIVCLRNIINSVNANNERCFGKGDTMYVDIYANWYDIKGDGYMKISFKQYSGLTTNHLFGEEIFEQEQTDCIGGGPYFLFVPTGTTKLVNSETTNRLYVKASGGQYAQENPQMATSYDLKCLDVTYSHIARLTTLFVGDEIKTSLATFTTADGFDSQSYFTKICYDGQVPQDYGTCTINTGDTADIEVTETNVPYEGAVIGDKYSILEFKNVFVKRKYYSSVKDIKVFTDSEYGNKCKAFIREWSPVTRSSNYKYSNFTATTDSHKISLSFIKNFEINENEQTGNVDIKFIMTENKDHSHREFQIFLYYVDIDAVNCDSSTLKSDRLEIIQEGV